MTHSLLLQVCAAVLVCAAAATDIQSRRIPNWLTLTGVLAGLLFHTIASGLGGLKYSAQGLLLGFGVYLALYCLHAIGAGDVKLMAAVGAFTGPENWLLVFGATAIAGGVLAVVLMVWKKRVRQTLWNTAIIVEELMNFRAPYRRDSDLDVKSRNSLNMPHGVAIAVGTLACVFAVGL